MRHLLLERAGADLHVADARQAVDLGGMRAGDVDHHRRIDLFARDERDAGNPAVCLADLHHLGIEAEGGALGLGGALGVVARKLRIADIAGAGEVDAAKARPLGRHREVRIVAGLGRPERAQVVERQARVDPLRAPVLPRDAERIHVAADRPQKVVVPRSS